MYKRIMIILTVRYALRDGLESTTYIQLLCVLWVAVAVHYRIIISVSVAVALSRTALPSNNSNPIIHHSFTVPFSCTMVLTLLQTKSL